MLYNIFMKIIIKWATLTLAIYLIASYTGLVSISEPKTAIYAALVLGLLNFFIKPILKILAFPINFLTLGLFSIIINGFLITIVPKFVSGFVVNGFWNGVIAAIIISIMTAILNAILVPKNHDD